MNLIRAALMALALCIATSAEPAATVAATVEQPRGFGYVLGDILTQRVLLEHEGHSLQPGALPAAGRVDLWLERGKAQIETDAQGRRWLAIGYQIINAPRELRAIALPALNIATTSGPVLALKPWPVSIAALTPKEAFGQGDLQALRPDRPVAALDTGVIERQIRWSLTALLGVLLLWLGWWLWRNALEARRLPFARAWHELQRIDDPASAQAWRIVHRALNASAGCVVHGTGLARLLDRAPYLRPLQAQLEDFYRESTRRFFADDAAPGKGERPYPLKALCRALRDVEKKNMGRRWHEAQ
ncbi:MAG: calcium incorporation protein MxaA [Burkholderiaceae bacterium]|jgi:mxaA protein|nr:calcium incorporation protein MxaA [Burkholderiaceae bacterium]